MWLFDFIPLTIIAFLVFVLVRRRHQLEDSAELHGEFKQDWLEHFAAGSMFVLMLALYWPEVDRIRFFEGLMILYAAYSFYTGFRELWRTRAKFSILGIMLLTGLVAVYCGVTRWLNPSREVAFLIGICAIGVFIHVRRRYIRRQAITIPATSQIENLKSEI
jgi:hypothetical protein